MKRFGLLTATQKLQNLDSSLVFFHKRKVYEMKKEDYPWVLENASVKQQPKTSKDSYFRSELS